MLLPVVSANTFTEELVIEQENVSLHINMSGFVTWMCEEPITEENHCDNFSLTALPVSVNTGEKISFGFSNWKTNDSVTYWVEDITGTILKDEYTTTSSTKKSYTPKLDGKERAIVFKAVRERDGCEEASAEQLVIVLGEEMACAEPEPCPEIVCEAPVTPASLYVRAERWQETITLYGRVEQQGTYVLFGEESPITITLEEGVFSVNITPRKGENTYGLVFADGGIPLLASFTLSFEEEEPSVNGTLVIPPPVTGDVILDNDTSKNTSLIAGLTGLAGAGLLISGLKTKLLRRKHDSA